MKMPLIARTMAGTGLAYNGPQRAVFYLYRAEIKRQRKNEKRLRDHARRVFWDEFTMRPPRVDR